MAENTKKPGLGISLLTVLYVFIIFTNVSTWMQYKSNSIVLSIVIGTLLYVIFGFLNRNPIARIMAIGFHIYSQFSIILVFMYLSNPKNLDILSKNLAGQKVDMAVLKNSVLFMVILLSIANIAAIIYLLKNRDFFKKIEE